MASVLKIRNKMPIIPGTKPSVKNAQLLVSSGIPSLDHVIGGGVPVGSLFLIEEHKYGMYAKVMLKYFMAEGVVTNHPLLIASQEVDPVELKNEIPAVATDPIPQPQETTEQMKIAWRYQNMKIFDPSPTGGPTFGHFYDLTKTMEKKLIENADITEWHEDSLTTNENMFYNSAYMDLLKTIQTTLKKGQFHVKDTPNTRKVLRIIIHSLGSLLWMSDSEEESHQDLVKFLYFFRALLKNSYAVGAITVPVDNYDNASGTVERIEHIADIAIRLESFAGSEKETNPLFKDYHGLLHVKKLPAINTLAPHSPESRDLAFKLRRRKFLIEVLHLPPEFEDTTQREQDDISSSVGCMSGAHKSNLDF